MGIEWISTVMQVLQEEGIRVQRGFPAEKMPYLTGPVVGLSLDQLENDSITLAARVYAPVNQGGPVCEDVAAQVVEVFNRLQAQSTVDCGSFDGATGLFCVTVKAKYEQFSASPKIKVYVDREEVPHLVRIGVQFRSSYERMKDMSTNKYYLSCSDYRWFVEIEDILAPGEMCCDRKKSFTVYVVHNGGTLSFLYCLTQDIELIPTAAGTRRIRKMICCDNPVENIAM